MLNLLVVCNKLVSSFWLMLSYGFWHFHHPNLLASSVLCIPFLKLRVGAYFASTSKPVGGLHPVLLHISIYIFLKTATITTYHSISIAVPRYIAMQLHFTLHDLLSFTVLYIMLWSYELFVPKVCCHFRVFAPARKEPRRPSKSEIEKEKKEKKRKRKKKQ